jgi:acyl-coenzyme A thioesterase PaaI-like protein
MSIDYALIGEGMKQAVPWVGTHSVTFEHVSAERVVASLPDAADQHNHVGGPHAAMIFGIGETASGAVVMAAFAEQMSRALPLVATADIRYHKVAKGDLRAEAVLGRAAEEIIAELDAGQRPEFPVYVTVTNAEGVTTTELTVVWTLRPNR